MARLAPLAMSAAIALRAAGDPTWRDRALEAVEWANDTDSSRLHARLQRDVVAPMLAALHGDDADHVWCTIPGRSDTLSAFRPHPLTRAREVVVERLARCRCGMQRWRPLAEITDLFDIDAAAALPS